MKQENDDFDWFKWASIKPSQRDKLIEEAKKNGVPIFESDGNEGIFNRIMTVKALENNRSTVKINIALTFISLISMIATIVTAFYK